MYKVELARTAKRAREAKSLEDELNEMEFPYPYVSKGSVDDITKFGWVYTLNLFIPATCWPIPYVPYRNMFSKVSSIVN